LPRRTHIAAIEPLDHAFISFIDARSARRLAAVIGVMHRHQLISATTQFGSRECSLLG
jgi:hypothetical protein